MMEDALSDHTTVLVVRLGTRLCAIPLTGVMECMRPLSITPVSGVPAFLLGLSLVRGAPTPVVHLAALVGARTDAPVTRFVLVQFGGRRVVIAVEDVVGVRRMGRSVLHTLPLLLEGTGTELVTGIGVRDEQLFFMLRLARVVSDEVWRVLDSREVGA